MRPHVPNDRLAAAVVPAADAPLHELLAFGHTFHAYRVAGSVDRVAALAAEAADAYEADGSLPGDLTTLRVVLFGLARALHHATDVDGASDGFVRALVAAVHDRLDRPG